MSVRKVPVFGIDSSITTETSTTSHQANGDDEARAELNNIQLPSLPPGYDKHHLVILEGLNCVEPIITFPHKKTVYPRTSPSEVAGRIKDATIVIATILPVTSADLDQAPNLKCIAILATGIGWLDRQYCAEHGITVVNCPQANVEAVGEHFLTLYFSSRRKVPFVHQKVTTTDEWVQTSTLTRYWSKGPPLSCAQEKLGVIGYGALGRRIETLAKSIGFGEVVIGDRKGASSLREGRVPFEELLKESTTIVVCCPKEADTINMIAEEEFEMMRPECLLINVARGGIVNEQALANTLKEGKIFGAATDVMDTEPAGIGSSPLLPDVTKGEKPIPNLVVTPHIAWFSQRTIENLVRMISDGINGYATGKLNEEHVWPNVVVYDGKVLR